MSYHCRETQRILSDFSEAKLPSIEGSADIPDSQEGDLTKHSQRRGDHKNDHMGSRTKPCYEPASHHRTMTVDRCKPPSLSRSTGYQVGLSLFPYRQSDRGETLVLAQVPVPLYPRIVVAVGPVNVQQLGFSLILNTNVVLRRQSAIDRE